MGYICYGAMKQWLLMFTSPALGFALLFPFSPLVGLVPLGLPLPRLLSLLNRSLGALGALPTRKPTPRFHGHSNRRGLHWLADKQIVAAVAAAPVKAELLPTLQTGDGSFLNQSRAVLHFPHRGGQQRGLVLAQVGRSKK